MDKFIGAIITGTITYYLVKQINQKKDFINITANIAIAAVVAAATKKILN